MCLCTAAHVHDQPRLGRPRRRDVEVDARCRGGSRASRIARARLAAMRSTRCSSSTLSIARVVEPHEQIAVARGRRAAAGLSGSTRLDLDRGRAEPVVVREPTIERAARRAPMPSQARRTRPCCEQLAEHPRRGLDGDREADALRARDDRGVDAEHAAARVEQRAAGVAGVERRGVLDDAVDQAVVAAAQRCGRAPTRRRSTPSTRSRAGCRSRPRAGRRAARSRRRPAGTATARRAQRAARPGRARGRSPDRRRSPAPSAVSPAGVRTRSSRAAATTWLFVST